MNSVHMEELNKLKEVLTNELSIQLDKQKCTRSALAKKLRISNGHLSDIERSRRIPSLSLARTLDKYLLTNGYIETITKKIRMLQYIGNCPYCGKGG